MQFDWTKPDVEIVKAAWATEQGQRLIKLIVERLGDVEGAAISLTQSDMAFNEGRRFVARELARAVKKSINNLVKEPDEPRDSRPITATERAARLAAGEPAGGHIASAAVRTGRTTR